MRLLQWCLIVCSSFFFLVGCQTPSPEHAEGEPVTRLPLPQNVVESSPKDRHRSRGQVLYVPCYSHIYLAAGQSYDLAITLSIRNTSRTKTLVVSSVSYYDSSGALVKEYADHEIAVGPLATTEYFVKERDQSGGSGACFLVRWVSEMPMGDPIVEAAMVGSSGSLGVSFLTTARVIEEVRADTPSVAAPQASSSPRPTPPPTP